MSQRRTAPVAPKKIDLAELGEGTNPNPWQGAYVSMRRMSFTEIEELAELQRQAEKDKTPEDSSKSAAKLFGFLGERFVEGRIPIADDKGQTELQEMQADDFRILTIDTVGKIVGVMRGTVDPKSGTPSTKSS